MERMGGIIIEGRAGLQFKGPISEFQKAIVGVVKLQKELGASRLMIDTVPLPEGGIIIDMRFKGQISEFEKVIVGLEKLRASVAIGTWPTPEKPMGPLRWVISARVSKE
jgi:hypothetical protein